MDFLRNLSESLAKLGHIDPVSQTAGTVLSGAINTKLHRRIFAVLQVGALTTATVDAKFTAAATSGGSYTDVAGTSITQITGAGGKYVVIELKTETLAAAGQGPFVKLSVTVGTAAVVIAAVVYGACDRYEPASDYDEAACAQIVVA